MQMKILRTGIIVGIDTSGKKKQHVTVTYPLKSGAGKPGGTKGQRPDINELRIKFRQQPQFMMLSGFKNNNEQVPLQAANGVMVKLDWDENNDMIYELMIPIQAFRTNKLCKDDLSKAYSLNVNIPAFVRPDFGGTGGPGGGNPGGGGGGRPGGGMTQSGGNEQFMIMFEEQKFSQKFTLVLQ
jgi:hypothetical protein